MPRTAVHCHACETWLFGLDGPVEVQSTNTGQRLRGDSVVIPAGMTHVLNAPETQLGVVLLDPLQKSDGLMADRLTQHAQASDWQHQLTREAPEWTCVDAKPGTRLRDPRIQAAVDCIEARLHENIPAAHLADHVGLSASRLQHVFAESTGLRLRQYRLWMRLLHAARDATRHGSLTEAAYANGFSSPSHLSTSFRSCFGLAPRAVLARF